MFDFDGTLGLVRAGWMPVMLDMMMETLSPLGPDPVVLRDQAEVYVARFYGQRHGSSDGAVAAPGV